MRLVTLSLALVFGVQEKDKTGFISKTIEYGGATVKYQVYVPPGYNPEKPHAAILFLHGAGETGTDGEKHCTVGLGPAIKKNADAWNFIVIFPQAQPGGEVRGRWVDQEKLILEILEKTKKEYKIDESRFYGTGLSMGGYGTWALAAKYPDLFAAIAPVCGGGDPKTAEKLKSIPIWNFHGDKDKAVPVERSQEMIDAIKAAGGSPKFTIYPGVGHNCWDKAYRDEKLHAWFLEHQRGKKK